MTGERPVDPLADERAARAVGPILATWMAAVAPEGAPERLLEEAFARTMAAPQAPVLPWHRWPSGWSSTPGGSRRLALAGLVAVVVVAIGAGLLPRSPGGTVGGPSSSPSPSASPVPSASASDAPSFPPAVTVQPIATIAVDAPIALASDGTTVWLFTSDNHLLRIDPQTNTVAASVLLEIPRTSFQAIAGDETGLWMTDWNKNEVVRFDPRTLKSVTSIGTAGPSKGLLLGGGALWVANTRGGSVERIDPATNTVAERISVGPVGASGPNWLAGGLGSLWVSVPNNRSVVRISLATKALQATIPIATPVTPCGGLAVTSAAVWVTSCAGGNVIGQVDPATNAQVAAVDLGGNSYTFTVVGDRAWISPEGGQLVRLDPVAHRVDRAIAPGAGFSGGGDVVVAAGSFWVIDGAAGRLLRLPLEPFNG